MNIAPLNMPANRRSQYVRYTLAVITFILGLVNLLSTLTPRLGWDILFHSWPVDIQYHLAVATIIVSYFLMVVPFGLVRGKRQSWRITIFLLATMVVFNLLGGGQVIRTALAIGLFITLLLTVSFFEARSDPPSILRGYLFLVFGLGIVILYALGGFLALFAHLHISGQLQQFIFGQALPVLALVAFLVGAFQILRPIVKVLLPDQKERQEVDALVHTYGTSSISYFALDADKTYFFSASHKVAISYVLKSGVAVVAGDPIGPEDEFYSATSEFLAMCYKQDWIPAFWQVRDVEASMYRKLGLNLLKIGEDDYLKEQGAEIVSLGLAPMGNVNTDDQTSLSTIVDFMTHRFGNLSQSQSLFKFKEKFHPSWESRYLVFTNPLQLPKVGLALYEAHQPDTSWITTLRKSVQDWQAKHQGEQVNAKEKVQIPEVAVHPGTGSLAL